MLAQRQRGLPVRYRSIDLLVLAAVWGLSCRDLVFVRAATEDLCPVPGTTRLHDVTSPAQAQAWR